MVNRWRGSITPEDLPALINPPEGYLAAANARVNAAGDGPLVSADNAPGYRIRRIKQVLSERDDLTVEDMRVLQTDWFDQQAALLMPTLMESIIPDDVSALVGDAFEVLQSWRGNFVADPDRAAPIIFQAWYRALAAEVFQPGMSEQLFSQVMQNNYLLNHALDRLILADRESEWWRGEREAIITRALVTDVGEVSLVQGTQIDTWRLDRMHAVKIEHELGKAVPQLSWLFNAKPAPWGGGPATVGRARYRYDRAYDATAGATVRVVSEMKQPGPVMAAVIPGGQSGHPLSGHYHDQLPHWLDGALLPIAATDQQVSGTIQTLNPGR